MCERESLDHHHLTTKYGIPSKTPLRHNAQILYMYMQNAKCKMQNAMQALLPSLPRAYLIFPKEPRCIEVFCRGSPPWCCYAFATPIATPYSYTYNYTSRVVHSILYTVYRSVSSNRYR